MKAIWTVARRELKSLFDHPMGYILLVVFVGLNDFLLLRTAYAQSLASLRPLLELLPWMFLVFVPAVTMRALAEDQRSGVLEVVLAQPITEVELILGKYIGQLLFIWLALGLTLLIPIGFSFGADLQVGVIFAQYVGAGLLAAAFAAVGLWASSLSGNQVTAFIIGAAVIFLLIFIGLNPLVVGLPPMLSGIAANLGVLSHFTNITRGVIDLRDAVYFATVAAIFLVLAYLVLMGRKLTPKGVTLKRLRLGSVLLIAALVVVNLFGSHIRGRIDLTPGKIYTLSSTTKQMLRNVEDIVLIKLFASRDMDPRFELLKRDINDLLGDFRSAGNGMVRVTVRDPASDQEAANDAETLGIPTVQFNVVGQGEYTVKEGYLGIAVQYAGQTETIPVVDHTENLEYRLVSYIRDLTRESVPVVGLVEDQAEQARGGGFSVLRQALTDGYEVRNIDLSSHTLDPDSITALILATSPFFLEDSVLGKVQDFVRQGGSAFIMASGMQFNPQSPQPIVQTVPVVWNQVLAPYGVSIRGDMVFDLASHEQASIAGRAGIRYFQGYPFWLRALSTQASTVNQNIQTMFLPWTSQVDTTGALPGSVTPLFVTSSAAGYEEGQAMVAPQRPPQDYPTDNLSSRLVGVMVNPLAADLTDLQSDSVATELPPRGRLIVIGSVEFAQDNWVRNAGSSIVFVMNAVDWLAQDEALTAIRSKNREPPALVFESSTLKALVQYMNWLGVPLLVIVVGLMRWVRRRRITQLVYVPSVQSEV
ncbi:MAG: Gldg family protein [Gemmatimonadota bacterium]|nr:MAG: Gldg family protein [Gemmatimonadota bacterium]